MLVALSIRGEALVRAVGHDEAPLAPQEGAPLALLLKRAVVSERPAEPRVRESGGTVFEQAGLVHPLAAVAASMRAALPGCSSTRMRLGMVSWSKRKRMSCLLQKGWSSPPRASMSRLMIVR